MIKTLHISCFRGIPSDLEISFTTPRGSTTSILLLGDNGTGKSSINTLRPSAQTHSSARCGPSHAKILISQG